MKYSQFRRRVRSLPVIPTSLLGTLTDQRGTLKVQLSLWKKKGLLRPLRRGLYVLHAEDRQVEPSPFYLANQIYLPSYVSLESALAFYGFIPEFVAATTSVTTRKPCRFENEFGIFTYQHIQPEGYVGLETMREPSGWNVLVATPEKAVVDYLYMNLPRFDPLDASVFTESVRFQNLERLDPGRLRAMAKPFGKKKLLSVVGLLIRSILR